MSAFVPRTKVPDPKNKAYVVIDGGGKNHSILGNPDGRLYKYSVLPNCTGYVHGRVIEITGSDDKLCRGNAENYWGYKKDGLKRGQTPQVGAIMCWRGGKAGYSEDGRGHVVCVEDINQHGDVTASESGWTGTKENGRYWRLRKIKKVNGTYPLGYGLTYQGCIYAYDPPVIKPVEGAVFRLYNPRGDEHMWTLNNGEANSLSRAGWIYEGIAWYAPKTGKPVYRLYNPNDSDHVLTAKEIEKDTLVKEGWKYEGIAFYSDGNVPIYRVYNPYSGEHFYAKNEVERNKLIRDGWKYEGIAFYGIK